MKKPLKTAAWSGLISFIIALALTLISLENKGQSPSIFIILLTIFSLVLLISFMNGFLVIGRKLGNKLLVVMTWIGILFVLIGVLMSVLYLLSQSFSSVSAQSADANFEQALTAAAAAVLAVIFIVWIIFSLIAGTYSVLFGVALLKLRNKIKFSKVSGILEIISGATYIIAIGFFIRLIAQVFEIAMMFKASETFEKH